MKRYIGIDPHQASSTIAVLSEAGKTLMTPIVETNGDALIATLRGVVGERHLVIEEGQYANWLFEILSPHVHSAIVAWGTGETGQKSDRIDAVNDSPDTVMVSSAAKLVVTSMTRVLPASA